MHVGRSQNSNNYGSVGKRLRAPWKDELEQGMWAETDQRSGVTVNARRCPDLCGLDDRKGEGGRDKTTIQFQVEEEKSERDSRDCARCARMRRGNRRWSKVTLAARSGWARWHMANLLFGL